MIQEFVHELKPRFFNPIKSLKYSHTIPSEISPLDVKIKLF